MWFSKKKSAPSDKDQDIRATGKYRIVEKDGLCFVEREVYWYHGGFSMYDPVVTCINKIDAETYINSQLKLVPKITEYGKRNES